MMPTPRGLTAVARPLRRELKGATLTAGGKSDTDPKDAARLRSVARNGKRVLA
jgi:hypothetical protein